MALGSTTPPAAAVIPTINNAWKSYTAGTPGTLTVAPTAGHTVILAIGCSDSQTPGAVPSVSDNIDGTTGWNKASGRTNVQTGYSMCVFIFYKFNVPSGITTLTTSGGASFANIESIAHDVSNISAFTASEVNNGQVVGGTNPQTGTVNNGTATSIYFAAADADADVGTWTINSTGTTGTWNHYSANSHEDDGHNFTATSVVNIVVSTSASRGHGWTGGITANYSACVAVFH